MNPYLISLNAKPLPEQVGAKARNLRLLADLGFRIPPNSWTCRWEAYLAYQNGDCSVMDALKSGLVHIVQPDRCYAVRSSANIEDGKHHSFAGQFKTVLNVDGTDGVLAAIQEVWRPPPANKSRPICSISLARPKRLRWPLSSRI